MRRSVTRRLGAAAMVTSVVALAWIGVALALTAPTPTPLSYSTTFSDPTGTQQSVSFTGTASGTSLTGTLTVNGPPEQLTATIGKDGSVSGKLLNPDGTQYGVFGAGRAGRGACRGAST